MRLAALIAIALAGVATADPAAKLVEAQRHFDELDYELVLPATETVLADPTATTAHKVRARYVRGAALVVLDRDLDAAAEFTAMLALDPTARSPDNAPPRIRAAFESARAAWRVKLEEDLETRYGTQLRAVKLEVQPPATATGGRPVTLNIVLADPHRLANRIVLGYRRADQREFSRISAPASTSVDLAIPGAVLASKRPYQLAWYVHALHASGAVLRREGDESSPRWLSVRAGLPPGPRPVSSRWWFWAGVVTVAGAAVAVPILIDRSRDVGPQRVTVGG